MKISECETILNEVELESWSKEELISWILAEDIEEGEVKQEDSVLEERNIFEPF